MAQAILAQLPADEDPHLIELTVEHVLKPGYDHDDEYDFGLGLILESLEHVRKRSSTVSRRR